MGKLIAKLRKLNLYEINKRRRQKAQELWFTRALIIVSRNITKQGIINIL